MRGKRLTAGRGCVFGAVTHQIGTSSPRTRRSEGDARAADADLSETLVHESSHGLGLFPVLIQPLNQTAAEQKVTVPPQLWHAVLFFTAGELPRRELNAHGIDYTEYAGAGLYMNLCGTGCRDKIAEHWTPYLDGKRSIADALSALVASPKMNP